MRKLKNILISGILSVCMVVTSLPTTLLAQEVETVQDDNGNDRQENTRDKVQYEIISFEELPESVKNQSVTLGTDIEELELPETLTASYRSFKEKPEDEKKPEDNTGDESGEKDSEDNTGDKGEEKEPEDNTGNEDDEKNPEESARDEGVEKDPEDNTGNEDEGKTPEVKPEDEGRDKTASETKIVQKTVEVHMKEYNVQPEDMGEPKTLVSEGSEAGAELNGENRQRDDTETIVIGNVTWVSSPSYDGDVEGIYVFTPVIAEDYVLAEDAVLPEIIVTVDEVEEADLSEEAEVPNNDVEVTPEIGVIDTDTTWTAGTLTDGTVTINEGVVLTITDVITITGQVTFEGNGTIERGDGKAYFVVNGDKELTLDVKIDGKSQTSSYPMIDVKDKGNLSLKEACTISNCVGGLRGGTICSLGGNIVIEGATIEKCSVASTDGGAIHAIGGSLTINGAVIDNCSTNGHAGGIYAIEVNTTIDDTEIKNCRSGGNGGAIHISGGMTVNNTIIENCSATANGGGVAIFEGVVTFNNTTIKGCSTPCAGGGIAVDENSKLALNNVTIENCAAGTAGGAIMILTDSELIINGGTYKNNSTTLTESINSDGFGGGGAIFVGGVLKIYDGNFINNTAVGRGGGIYHSGYTDSTTYLYGGHFEGNTCTDLQYAGSGAVFIASEGYEDDDGYNTGDATFVLSGAVEFCGDGVSPATDGIFLDSALNIPRRLRLINSLSYPLDIHLDAVEHYIIAEGIETDSGKPYIIQKQDMKKMSIHDTKGEKWYKYLDEENNQVYISKTPPSNVTAVFYSGEADSKEIITQEPAEGDESVTITAPDLTAMDGWTKLGWNTDKDGYTGDIPAGRELTISEDTSYYGVYKRNVKLSYDANGGNSTPESESGECLANVHETITYETSGFSVAADISADDPDWEFVGWNTERNGTGNLYRDGEIIEITEDTTLYATFERPPYATFYSGSAGDYEVKKTNVVTGKIIAPPLKEKEGWNEIGWDEDKTGYKGRIKAGSVLELSENTSYYGAYEKRVTLSYDAGEITAPAGETQVRHAKVREDDIIYDSGEDSPELFEFNIAPDISKDGYEFMGWNTQEDGKGDFYKVTDTDRNRISITSDTTLYAVFKLPLTATFYSGSAGESESRIAVLSGKAGSGTVTAPELKEMTEAGWVKAGWDTEEGGYSGDIAVGSEITLYEDTAFYGIYKKEVALSYDGNGWGTAPVVQNGSIYTNVHDSISYKRARFTVAPAINRAGYSFLGWSTSENVDESSHIYGPNESIEIEDSVTLYAQMIDDIAPVLGDASYNSGYTDIGDWLVRKKDLVITVPITEEGSGVNKIVYTLTPENGEPVTGEALMGEAYVPRQVRQAAVVQFDVAGGKMNVTSGRTCVNIDTVVAQDTTAGDQSGATGGQVGTTDGQIQARITISEDYKGTVSLKCLDNAGNESADKLLTATDGGVIVEDNAPQISFGNKNIKNNNTAVTVSVSDDVDTDKNSRITGGIASITYQVDDKQEQNVTTKNFAEEIVSACEFSVDISGSGEHILKVTAIDNAGNESQQSTKVIITAKNRKTTVIEQNNSNPPTEDEKEFVPLVEVNKTELPNDSEPATGDNSIRVEVYATIAMIAGLLYILLYFITGNNGMTEEDKNKFVSRILTWAKKGGKFRKYVAIAAIFCVLFYYHSIGKRVNVEWNEVADYRV